MSGQVFIVESEEALDVLVRGFEDANFGVVLNRHEDWGFLFEVSIAQGGSWVSFRLSESHVRELVEDHVEDSRDRGYFEQLWRE